MIPLEGEAGGHALNSHGDYIVDHGKSLNSHGNYIVDHGKSLEKS